MIYVRKKKFNFENNCSNYEKKRYINQLYIRGKYLVWKFFLGSSNKLCNMPCLVKHIYYLLCGLKRVLYSLFFKKIKIELLDYTLRIHLGDLLATIKYYAPIIF